MLLSDGLFLGLLCSFNHENVLSIKDLIIPLNENGQCEDIYIITELLDTDLSKVIYSPQPLIDDHCQYFIYQVSRCIAAVCWHIRTRAVRPHHLLLPWMTEPSNPP